MQNKAFHRLLSQLKKLIPTNQTATKSYQKEDNRFSTNSNLLLLKNSYKMIAKLLYLYDTS